MINLDHDKYGRGQQSAFQQAKSVCVQKEAKGRKRPQASE